MTAMMGALTLANELYEQHNHEAEDIYSFICAHLLALGYSDKVVAYAIDELP